jgi:hypothetical protein
MVITADRKRVLELESENLHFRSRIKVLEGRLRGLAEIVGQERVQHQQTADAIQSFAARIDVLTAEQNATVAEKAIMNAKKGKR